MSGDKCHYSLSCSDKVRIGAGIWGDLEDNVIVGKDNGDIDVIELKKGSNVKTIKAHSDIVTDMQKHADGTMFISASKDHTAKVG